MSWCFTKTTHYPHDLDGTLNADAANKIRQYLVDYHNRPSITISFIPTILWQVRLDLFGHSSVVYPLIRLDLIKLKVRLKKKKHEAFHAGCLFQRFIGFPAHHHFSVTFFTLGFRPFLFCWKQTHFHTSFNLSLASFTLVVNPLVVNLSSYSFPSLISSTLCLSVTWCPFIL
jgi:hypothetical protein